MKEYPAEGWEEIPDGNETVGCAVRPDEGEAQIASRYGSSGSKGYIFLLDDGEVKCKCRPINPRSTDCSPTGRAVFADWRKYGSSTGSEVTVLESDGSNAYTTELNASSPLVAISEGGQYIAICPYNGQTRVVEIENGNLVTLHNNLVDDRQKPVFRGKQPVLYLGQSKSDKPSYAISLADEIVWKDDEFSDLHLVTSIELDADSHWPEILSEFEDLYLQGDKRLQEGINETLSESSLATIDNENRLREIVTALENYYSVTETDDEKRAAAIPLADAYYRLAKSVRRESSSEKFWKNIESAIEYGQVGLPWYQAKQHLAKSYRLEARTHERRNDLESATTSIEQIFKLEEEYNVQLATDADRRFRDRLIGG